MLGIAVYVLITTLNNTKFISIDELEFYIIAVSETTEHKIITILGKISVIRHSRKTGTECTILEEDLSYDFAAEVIGGIGISHSRASRGYRCNQSCISDF